MTQQWHASVSFASGPNPPTPKQFKVLADNLPGYTIAVHDGRRLTVELTVEASTLKRAEDEAHKAAKTAYGAAFDVVGTEVAIRVLTQEDHEQELARPDPYDLVGIAEITEMGSFNSRQAASDAAKHPDFPAPVAELRMGKVWTRHSVDLFLQRWPRKAGWAGKRAADAAIQ